MSTESSDAPRSVLLDTSVVIALFQERRRFTLASFERVAISSLTVAELRLGVAMAGSADVARARMAALEETQGLFGTGIPFDDRAAAQYGRISAHIQRRGGDPKAHRTDRMIAAIAAAHDLGLVTLNPVDLRGTDELVRVLASPTA
ncbi:type II toxin-antitoxin system VapC family toxin [Microbacterium sp.]|uniref:type II toxin-antitoxin system VapC family toxin n=1 Tax=Microbacterium sp. TaxID=51671 RepID=UPI0039E2DBC1